MLVAGAKIGRDDLLREICCALSQWSELERNVFARAHYHGQSLDLIAQSLGLDLKKVDAILKVCDCRLYSFLREFRKGGCTKKSSVPGKNVLLDARSKELKKACELVSKADKNFASSSTI